MIKKVSIFRRIEKRGKPNWIGCLQEVSACFKLVVENKVYFQFKYKKKEKWFPCLLEETWSFGLLQTSFMWVQRNPRPGLCWSTGLRDKLQVIFCQINIFCPQLLNHDTTTDFVRFTKIYYLHKLFCWNSKHTSFASFEILNNFWKSL